MWRRAVYGAALFTARTLTVGGSIVATDSRSKCGADSPVGVSVCPSRLLPANYESACCKQHGVTSRRS
jgi:hypothetical protein